jgi:hypothetical protein
LITHKLILKVRDHQVDDDDDTGDDRRHRY